MRIRFKKVTDPMLIKAEFIYTNGRVKRKRLFIKFSTDRMQTTLDIDTEKTYEKVNRIQYKYNQKQVWVMLRGISCRCNRHTRYKDFLYLLRNPHTALVFLNSETRGLKQLAEQIIKGKKIIFPRETRYTSGYYFEEKLKQHRKRLDL